MLDHTQENLQNPASIEITAVHDTRLTSSEIASLWTTYQNSTLLGCLYKHYRSNVDSPDIGSLINYDLDFANKRIAWVKSALEKENLSVPMGFTDEDVNIQAPRLYSDPFYLYNILDNTRVSLTVHGLSLSTSTRRDIQEFYAFCCNSTVDICQKATELLLAKGLYIRPPYIFPEKSVETVREQSFMAGFIGDRRPLLASEVSGIFYGVRISNLGRFLLMGFRQVAISKQLHDYLNRGLDLTNTFINRYSSFLSKENIPTPMPSDTFVTDSTVPPFSEKLMMNQVLFYIAAALSSQGTILSTCFRRDISSTLALSMSEMATYLDDGANLAIKNNWLEEPPHILNRKELANKIH